MAVEDQSKYDEIVQWANKEVFNEKFDLDSIAVGGYAGPGQREIKSIAPSWPSTLGIGD